MEACQQMSLLARHGTVRVMRHIGTLIAAIVIGPLAWILIAFGQDRSAAAFANAQSTGAFHTGDFVRPLIFLAAAGLILGLIATLRFSPLGAGLLGVVYVLSYVWLFIDAKGLLNLFKRDLSIGGETADPTVPVRTGTTLILGALLLVAVFSASRWRRWPKPAAATEAGEEAPTGTAPDNGEPFGLGPGDPAMFRSAGAAAPDSEARTGSLATDRDPSGEEPTESGIPAQPSGTESHWSTTPAESSTRLINPDRSEPATGAGRTPAGSPWSTPLRDEEQGR
jgi:hypothetical protein